MTQRGTRTPKPGPCSFCKKTSDQVRRLIAGPEVFICDECVAVCVDILEDDARPEPRGQIVAEALRAALADRGHRHRSPVAREPSDAASSCNLCQLPVLLQESILVDGRGLLCRGCVSAVQAAAAQAASDDGDDQK